MGEEMRSVREGGGWVAQWSFSETNILKYRIYGGLGGWTGLNFGLRDKEFEVLDEGEKLIWQLLITNIWHSTEKSIVFTLFANFNNDKGQNVASGLTS